MAKFGSQPVTQQSNQSTVSQEPTPGPFINILTPEEIGTGASITVTEVTPYSGFIEIITGNPIDPGNPSFRLFRGDYTAPRDDEKSIPVQITPASSNVVGLDYWVIMGETRLTILATNFQSETSYTFAYSFY